MPNLAACYKDGILPMVNTKFGKPANLPALLACPPCIKSWLLQEMHLCGAWRMAFFFLLLRLDHFCLNTMRRISLPMTAKSYICATIQPVALENTGNTNNPSIPHARLVASAYFLVCATIYLKYLARYLARYFLRMSFSKSRLIVYWLSFRPLSFQTPHSSKILDQFSKLLFNLWIIAESRSNHVRHQSRVVVLPKSSKHTIFQTQLPKLHLLLFTTKPMNLQYSGVHAVLFAPYPFTQQPDPNLAPKLLRWRSL